MTCCNVGIFINLLAHTMVCHIAVCDLFIYLGYNTMVVGFTYNHTYMQGKQQENKQLEYK